MIDFTIDKESEFQVYKEAQDHFVNLHCHNDFSTRDALGKLDDYLALAKQRGLKYFNTTNHGTLSDWARLYKGCTEKNIIPVFGVEAYINRVRLEDKEKFKDNLEPFRKNHHCTILVKNLEGFQNLIKITNDAYLNGFYYKPRTDLEFIKKHSKGLIGLSGCGAGEIPRAVADADFKKAEELIKEYSLVFEDFYIELPIIEYKEQALVNSFLIKIAQKLGIKTVVTGDVHYVGKNDAEVHDVLILVREDQTIDDKKEGRDHCYSARALHYKTFQDVVDLWKKYYKSEVFTSKVFSDSVNTVFDILKSVDNIKFDTTLKLPKVFEGNSNSVLLDSLKEGIKKKIPNITKEYEDRIKREYEIITSLGFADFFLLVSDLNRWCKQNNILYGPGRGSVGGSLIAYLLDMTEIDPLKYGLLFERFIDYARKDVPDVDTDYDSDQRDRIIQRLKEKFGEDHVLNIGIFQTNKTRSVIQDVARVFKIPAQEVFAVTKTLTGNTIEIDLSPLDELIDQFPDLFAFFEKYQIKRYVNLIRDGIRNVGQHACGVCIADRNLYENIPIIRAKDVFVTGWEEGTGGAGLKDFGYMKFDILGLTNLTTISRTIDLINARYPDKKLGYYDIYNFPEDDKDVLKSLNISSIGIFQFESKLAQNVIKTINVDDFNDICAINAILRPGPLRMGVDKSYGLRKRGEENFEVHDSLKPILNSTFGIILYQEQIMQITQAAAGFTSEESNQIRKLLSKYREWENFGDPKRMKEIADWEEKFITRATKTLGEKESQRLFKEMASFANYGFNKSHALGYAKIAYINLYLRHYYPVEYFSALLACQGKGTNSELSHYIKHIKKFGIKFKVPNINTSSVTFSPVDEKTISWSLSHINYLTYTDAVTILENRPYSNFADFYQKILKADKKILNKSKINALIFAGCFDDFGSKNDIYNAFGSLKDKKWQNVTLTDQELELNEIDSLTLSLKKVFDTNDYFALLKEYIQKKNIDFITPTELSDSTFNKMMFASVLSVKKKQSKAKKEMLVVSVRDDDSELSFYVWKNNFSSVKNLKPNDFILFSLGRFEEGSDFYFLNKLHKHLTYEEIKKSFANE